MDAHGETRPRKRNRKNKERYVEPEPEIYEEKIIEEEDIGDDSWNDYHVEEDTPASLTYKILFFLLLVLLGGLATVVLIDNNLESLDAPNGVQEVPEANNAVDEGVGSSWLDWLTTEPHEDHGVVEEHSDEAREFVDHDHDHDDEEHAGHELHEPEDEADDDDQPEQTQAQAEPEENEPEDEPEEPVEEPIGYTTAYQANEAQLQEDNDDDNTPQDDANIAENFAQDTNTQVDDDDDDDDEDNDDQQVPAIDPNDIRSDVPVQEEEDEDGDDAPAGLEEPEIAAQEPPSEDINNIEERANEFDEIDNDDDDDTNNVDNLPELERTLHNIFDEDLLDDEEDDDDEENARQYL